MKRLNLFHWDQANNLVKLLKEMKAFGLKMSFSRDGHCAARLEFAEDFVFDLWEASLMFDLVPNLFICLGYMKLKLRWRFIEM